MNIEINERLKPFLPADEKIFLVKTFPASLPAEPPDMLVFENVHGDKIVEFLSEFIDAGKSVKRVAACNCEAMPVLREWLKGNGYIIYGEDLWEAEQGIFSNATAAVKEEAATVAEAESAHKGLAAEAYIYGTEELYNEFPLLLRVNNNQALPGFIYVSLSKIEQTINEINAITTDENKLPSELKAKKREALLKKQQLSIMANNMYPID